MASHLKISFLWPFKMVPQSTSAGIHFDDDWSLNQIKSFERRVYYKQKWQKSDTTKLQIESSILPDSLKVYNPERQLAKEFAWTAVFTTVAYKIYEVEFDISDLSDGVYFLYQRVAFASAIEWIAISEPVHVKTEWKNTLGFRYKHSFNDYDVAFTTGLEFFFRCEGCIPPTSITPKRDATEFVSQNSNTELLKGYPARQFVLHIGGTDRDNGLAPWVTDLMSRIFSCDTVYINDKRYSANPGADFKNSPIKGYPLLASSLEIVESRNPSSLEFADTEGLAEGLAGIVTAYNIETSFFGPGALVPVIEVEENG